MAGTIKGGVALITGAGSGIGAALATALAQEGCDVALADIDEAGLLRTAERAAAFGVGVSAHVLDVADAKRVAGFPAEIEARHGRLTILVNNAGVAMGGTFEQLRLEDFDWLMSINFWGVVRLTKAFLPMLKREEASSLVNISSLFGIIAPPGQTAYCASKFAVRGFTEALRSELSSSSVAVTVVHPGGVATAIARNSRMPPGANPQDVEAGLKRMDRMLKLSPDRAATMIVDAIRNRKPRLLIGSDARFAERVQRLFPVSYARKLARFTYT